MPNSFVDAYRKNLADQGLTDDTGDYELMRTYLGPLAEKNPDLLKQYPDFAREYGQLREANAPGLGTEMGRAAKRGGLGLLSTGLGGLSLLTGDGFLRNKAREYDTAASSPDIAPTIPSIADVAPGETGASRFFSKDALRYAAGKVGEAVPSIGEAAGLAVAGGIAGSALEPGVGTVVGAGEGLVEAALGRGIIKSAIKDLLKKGAASGLTEEAIVSGVRAGTPEIVSAVTQAAKQIAGARAGTAVAALNSYVLNSGDVLSEVPDRPDLAMGLGLISALPDTILPALLVKKLFPGVSLRIGTDAAKEMVGENALKLGKKLAVVPAAMGGEYANEFFQEAVDVVARNIRDGKDPLTFTADDYKRFNEAGIGGAAGGLLAAPGLALEGRKTEVTTDPAKAKALPPPAGTIQTPLTTSQINGAPTPVTLPTTRTNTQIIAAIDAMAPEEQTARLQELASLPTRTPEQDTEFQLLQQYAPKPPVGSILEPPTSAPPVVAPIAPTEIPAPTGITEPASAVLPPSEPPAAAEPPIAPTAAEPVVAAMPAVAPEVFPAPVVLPLTSDQVHQMAPADFFAHYQTAAAEGRPSMTTDALAVGDSATTPEAIDQLKTRRDEMRQQFKTAMDAGQEDAASFLAAKSQWFNEAYEQATKTGASAPRVVPVDETPAQAAIAESPKPLEIPPVVPSVAEPAPSPAVVELQKPAPPTLDYGAIVQGSPSVDFSTFPATVSPDQWEMALRKNITPKSGDVVKGDKSGNRALTRIGLALQKPGSDEVVFVGITTPQRINKSTGGTEVGGIALQRMGTGKEKRVVQDGGDQPVLLKEVLAAGYKPLAVVHFRGEPTTIFQRFASPAEFTGAWDAAGRNAAPKVAEVIAAPNATAVVADAELPVAQISGLARIEAEIDRIGRVWKEAAAKNDKAEVARLMKRYGELAVKQEAALTSNQTQTGDVPIGPNDLEVAQRITTERQAQRLPIDATHAQTFTAVVDRLRSMGGRVDLFGQEFFRQGTRAYIEAALENINQRLAAATTDSQRAQLMHQQAMLQERLSVVDQAQGATFGPNHIAISLEDVQNANTGNLVTLLHEAAEQLTMGMNPTMRGAVSRAVIETLSDLRQQRADAVAETGVNAAKETGPIDLLAETLAQKFTAEGIPDAPTLAKAIIRWIKDLYYRVSMAAQAAFGVQPNPETALNWFENQMRRIVSGDYDYRLARMLDPYMRISAQDRVQKFAGRTGTPGGVVEYFDPYQRNMRNPQVLTTSSEAFDWNVQFRQDNPGGEDIPDVEARARQHAAAVNRVLEKTEAIYRASGTDMPWPQWWKLVGSGEDPRMILAQAEAKIPKVSEAKIGGERMTDAMNQAASLEARRILENIQFAMKGRIEEASQQIETESDKTIAAAREVNAIEGDRRASEVHEGVLQKNLKAMVSRFIGDYSKGLDTAEQHGELAQAVRQADSLLESDPIPTQYQEAFQKIMAGETPVWNYVREIAKLELPLAEMSPAEVRRAIRDNTERNPELAALAKDKPLLVALSTLAAKNAAQMDDIALGRMNDAAKYAKIHAELEEIRAASPDQLRQMQVAIEEKGKATSLRDRLRADYVKRRLDLRTAQERVRRAQQKVTAMTSAIDPIATAVEEAQIQGSAAPSDWTVKDGAVFTEMKLGSDGKWSRGQRTLRFNPDGTVVDGDQVRQAIFANNDYLKTHLDKQGGRTWQEVHRQTTELAMLDVKRAAPAAHAFKITKLLAPIVENLKRIGGPSALRGVRMLNEFEFVRSSHSQEVDQLAGAWEKSWQALQKSTGITDNGVLQQKIYDRVNYFLGTNPGMDEEAAIRNATKLVRNLLPKAPDENFAAAMGNLLRSTKEISTFLLARAEQYGAFVKDPRLKSGLRRAVALGWLTNMRQLDGGLVQRIVEDMQKSGWTLGYKEEKIGDRTSKQVAGSTTFKDITAQDTAQTNTPALSGVLQKLFTPGIVRDWLEPFINKGGTEVFRYGKQEIPQLDLQDAWSTANGDVLAWIDALAKKVDIGTAEEIDGEEGATMSDPLADFRLSMLKQLDGLFGMEAKQAYEWSQTRDLFDPQGPKRHVMMDARLNDQIPPEHLDFALYDRHSAQMMLAEIAFHAKFGRNGEAMIQSLSEMSDQTKAARAVYEGLTGTREANRILEAKALGWDYKDLKAAAKRAGDVEELKNNVESLMSVGRPGGPFDESRAGLAFMQFATGQIVDNPKTGSYNWLSNFERPLMQSSLGPAAIRASFKATGSSLEGAFGSTLDALGLHLMHSSDYYKTISQVLGGARNQQWSQALADIGPGGKQNFSDRVFVRPLRLIRYIQNKGVGRVGFGESKEYPRQALLPGAGVGNYLGQLAGVGGSLATAQQLEGIIAKGIKFFATDHEAMTDPNFRFKGSDIGFGKLDQGVFEWWRNKSVEYGMGNLEDIVRGAMERQTKNEPLLTKDQLLRSTQMSMTEFDGQSSINTTPTMMQTNPWLKRALPLLRWPFNRMSSVQRTLWKLTPEGQRDYAALARGLGTLALWNLPIGLAFTFMMDRYDEDLLKKKSNLPSLGAVAGVPFVGPLAELMSSDRSIPDTLKAYLVRSARAGNTYGVASDLMGQIASPSDSASGRRVFSMDQRVLAMSQLLNVQQAISNAVNQDWTTTWASVWSPLMRSLGGNGALHAIDLVNNALGLDNEEARQVMRINAQNWLRAAASESDVEVKTGGGTGTPTPLSVWSRQMASAAMANDRIGFMEAHNRALEAARKVVANDSSVKPENREKEAEARVFASWRSRDPLAIFAQRPTDIQMSRMFGTMDDQGQQDVREAINRYAQFTALIKNDPIEARIQQGIRRLQQPFPRSQLIPSLQSAIGPLF